MDIENIMLDRHKFRLAIAFSQVMVDRIDDSIDKLGKLVRIHKKWKCWCMDKLCTKMALGVVRHEFLTFIRTFEYRLITTAGLDYNNVIVRNGINVLCEETYKLVVPIEKQYETHFKKNHAQRNTRVSRNLSFFY